MMARKLLIVELVSWFLLGMKFMRVAGASEAAALALQHESGVGEVKAARSALRLRGRQMQNHDDAIIHTERSDMVMVFRGVAGEFSAADVFKIEAVTGRHVDKLLRTAALNMDRSTDVIVVAVTVKDQSVTPLQWGRASEGESEGDTAEITTTTPGFSVALLASVVITYVTTGGQGNMDVKTVLADNVDEVQLLEQIRVSGALGATSDDGTQSFSLSYIAAEQTNTFSLAEALNEHRLESGYGPLRRAHPKIMYIAIIALISASSLFLLLISVLLCWACRRPSKTKEVQPGKSENGMGAEQVGALPRTISSKTQEKASNNTTNPQNSDQQALDDVETSSQATNQVEQESEAGDDLEGIPLTPMSDPYSVSTAASVEGRNSSARIGIKSMSKLRLHQLAHYATPRGRDQNPHNLGLHGASRLFS